MNKILVTLLVAIGLLMAMTWAFVPIATAAGNCPSQKNGKCPEPAKTKTHSRSDFTAEEREKMTEQGRQLCKKRYGATSKLYKIDYRTMKVICWEASGY